MLCGEAAFRICFLHADLKKNSDVTEKKIRNEKYIYIYLSINSISKQRAIRALQHFSGSATKILPAGLNQ